MPIYEYQCKQCGHQLEVIQKISDKRLRKCPACGKQSLSKLVSAAGFRLKGGGWYETDFKSGKKKNVAGGEAGGENGGGKSDSDSKSSKDTSESSSKSSSTDSKSSSAKSKSGSDKATKSSSKKGGD